MNPSIKLLYDRCIEEGNCRIWQQAVNSGGAPVVSLSAKDRGRSVRPILWRLFRGDLPEGHYVFTKCGIARCIAAGCLRSGTRSDYMLNASKRGVYSTPELCAIRARAARSGSHIDMGVARAIRAERASGRFLREIAAERGLSMDMVSKIARGLRWREAAAYSSVFNMAHG